MTETAGLVGLGFMPEQIVRCRTNSEARLLIPARINGEAVQMVFALSNRYHLYQSYADRRGLSAVVELSAFGRTLANQRVDLWGEYHNGETPIAGYIGSGFLEDGIVAVDASLPAMAFAPAREHLSLDGAVSRIRLGPGYTVALSGGTFAVAYQSTSVVAPRVAGSRRPGRNGRVDVELEFPGGVTITESIPVHEFQTKLDGILGADLLCRWITVFDFPARELLLFSYA